MGFPGIDYNDAVARYEQAVLENGTDLQVKLRSGEEFTVRGTIAKLAPEELTAGMDQQGHKIKIPVSAWDAVAGRSPEKGDQIVAWGRRSALMSWRLSGVGNSPASYILVMRG